MSKSYTQFKLIEADRPLIFKSCYVCGSIVRVTMPDDWQEQIKPHDQNRTVPVIECGNPWHYTNMEWGDHKHQFEFREWPYTKATCTCGAVATKAEGGII